MAETCTSPSFVPALWGAVKSQMFSLGLSLGGLLAAVVATIVGGGSLMSFGAVTAPVADATCPCCGTHLADRLGTVKIPATSTDTDETVRVPVGCPNCDALLTVVLESAPPDVFGVDVYVEARRGGAPP